MTAVTSEITDRQIAALQYLVFKSRDGDEWIKRIFACLLVRSENLTQEVYLTLTDGVEGFTEEEIREIALNQGPIRSSHCNTHLSEIFEAMGSSFSFTAHYGHIQGGRVNARWRGERTDTGMPVRYTFFLSKRRYGADKGIEVQATREELAAIDISKPDLYTKPELLNEE